MFLLMTNLLLLLLLNRLPTDITVGQGLEKTTYYNLYNFFLTEHYNTGKNYLRINKRREINNN
jgi:hypothetical protein